MWLFYHLIQTRLINASTGSCPMTILEVGGLFFLLRKGTEQHYLIRSVYDYYIDIYRLRVFLTIHCEMQFGACVCVVLLHGVLIFIFQYNYLCFCANISMYFCKFRGTNCKVWIQ